MEWVEITAKTVDEARELALDQLGVDEQDAEIEVVEEPKTGFFGKLRGQARVRARVRPTQVRPKVERRDRRRRRDDGRPSRGGESGRAGGDGAAGDGVAGDDAVSDEDAEATSGADDASSGAGAGAGARGGAGGAAGRNRRRRGGGNGGGGRERGSGQSAGRQHGGPGDPGGEDGAEMPELTIDEQADVVADFLRGLADRFGVAGTETAIERVEEDTVEVRIQGGDLGLLIGPKGQTLHLIQELARTTVQRRGGGIQEGRIRIDIAGYRQRRREALERFTQQVAADVVASGKQKALEPMNPADRKVVHDAVNNIDGVRTISEGEEPRRRVVLLPDAPASVADDAGSDDETVETES